MHQSWFPLLSKAGTGALAPKDTPVTAANSRACGEMEMTQAPFPLWEGCCRPQMYQQLSPLFLLSFTLSCNIAAYCQSLACGRIHVKFIIFSFRESTKYTEFWSEFNSCSAELHTGTGGEGVALWILEQACPCYPEQLSQQCSMLGCLLLGC